MIPQHTESQCFWVVLVCWLLNLKFFRGWRPKTSVNLNITKDASIIGRWLIFISQYSFIDIHLSIKVMTYSLFSPFINFPHSTQNFLLILKIEVSTSTSQYTQYVPFPYCPISLLSHFPPVPFPAVPSEFRSLIKLQFVPHRSSRCSGPSDVDVSFKHRDFITPSFIRLVRHWIVQIRINWGHQNLVLDIFLPQLGQRISENWHKKIGTNGKFVIWRYGWT